MPLQHKRKRTTRKRPMTKKRSHRRPKQQELVIFKPIGSSILPFPSRYRTKLTSQIYGYIPSGVSNNTMTCGFNYLLTPWGPAWTNSSPSQATLAPTGFSSLYNANLYQSYRVYGSKIAVELLPESLLDTLQVCIVPTTNYTGGNIGYSMNQPLARNGLMSATKDDHNSKKGSLLTNSCTLHKLLGVSRQAIEDDLSDNYVGNNIHGGSVGKPYNWAVLYRTLDGSNLTANCKYRAMVEYYVEFFNPFAGQVLEV